MSKTKRIINASTLIITVLAMTVTLLFSQRTSAFAEEGVETEVTEPVVEGGVAEDAVDEGTEGITTPADGTEVNPGTGETTEPGADETNLGDSSTGEEEGTGEITEPAVPLVSITISTPKEWQKGSAKVEIAAVDLNESGNFTVQKLEAKIGQNGSWQDITDDGYLEISEDCVIYVQVTDTNDFVYSKNKSISCFDKTKPSLNAAVNNGTLSIQAQDNESGVDAIYVNGYKFDDLDDGNLVIRLDQFDSGYEYFAIQAKDSVGNMSEIYRLKNPYYDDDPTDNDTKGKETLPVKATPTAPTSATATVTSHKTTDATGTVKEVEKKVDENGEAEKSTQFYTIQTKSEKVFYLIVDNDGKEETVYFLTEISEADLLNVTEDNKDVLPQNSAALNSAIPTDVKPGKVESDESDVVVTEVVEEPVIEPEKKGLDLSKYGTWIVIGGLSALFITAYYFLKIKKKKTEDFIDEEDDTEDDDEEYFEPEVEDLDPQDDFLDVDIEDVTETL